MHVGSQTKSIFLGDDLKKKKKFFPKKPCTWPLISSKEGGCGGELG